ncbi:hypothetical protein HNP84_003612 [Thermocatellispora tengchongensis]|uniref:Uncharacterized protein n=1 Tax=Thermocatellispora tengchongensis TaxID=1073253 RepID=A0A840P5Q6_9ACTN|nr:hypothetical protein [Thermocatellispora tengchongensis]MBB5133886.1 hypothetical protein [Thermocatellispora tengchongensis]
MGYELRVERESPLAFAELAGTIARAGFELRGSQESGEVVARHGDTAHAVAIWRGRLYGEPASDWQVAQLAVLSQTLGARLVGEDGEVYAIRDGIVEQVNGGAGYEFGKLEEILAAGPAQWSR